MSAKISIAMAAGIAALLAPVAVSAAETVTYTYDARGRLVKIVRTCLVNNNEQAVYTLDKEGNRTNVITTGA